MSALLLDIHFAEAYSSILPKDSNTQAASLSGKNLDSLAMYHQAIFSKHKINIQDWEQALKWYTQHPQELDSVYAHILPILDSLKTINIPTTEVNPKRN
jgi:plasmid replication initiation protein